MVVANSLYHILVETSLLIGSYHFNTYKEKIQSKARKSGLSTTEYVKQRALGYEPRGIPPDALFVCLEKLGELADKASSPELDEEIYAVLKQITAEFLLPGKG